jgi:hypothetical protein
MEPKYFYAKIKIDGRCIDLLLTQTEVTRSYNRAKENHGIMDEIRGYSDLCCDVPVEPKKCSIWEKLLGKCNCKD